MSKASEKYEVTRNFGIYILKKRSCLKKKDSEVVLSHYKYIKKQITREEIEYYQSLLKEYGYNIAEEEKGVVGTNTLQAILAYALHFTGPEILKDEVKNIAWNNLWIDSSNNEARNLLSQLTENDVKCLADILDQF